MRVLDEKPGLGYLLAVARAEGQPRERLFAYASCDRVVRLSNGKPVGQWIEYMSEAPNDGLFRTGYSCDGSSCSDYEIADDEVYVGVVFESPEFAPTAKQAEFVVRADGLYLEGAGSSTAKAAGIGIVDALLRGGSVWS